MALGFGGAGVPPEVVVLASQRKTAGATKPASRNHIRTKFEFELHPVRGIQLHPLERCLCGLSLVYDQV